MAGFTAKDVQRLRQETGAGMMDAKKALENNDGDFEEAKQELRNKGIAKAEQRADRENADGAVALAVDGSRAALVHLKCETDFSAKADAFVALAQTLADAVLAGGDAAVDEHSGAIDDLRLTQKENIEVGRAVLVEAADGNVLDTYLHSQDGRGTNAVIVEATGIGQDLAHEIALHIAFAKPAALSRDEIDPEAADKERAAALEVTKAEGKPEAAWDKIVEGRLNKWYADRVLLEQGMFGEKETVSQKLGGGSIVRFVQAYIGD